MALCTCTLQTEKTPVNSPEVTDVSDQNELVLCMELKFSPQYKHTQAYENPSDPAVDPVIKQDLLPAFAAAPDPPSVPGSFQRHR